jgi:hypothetical protein
MKNVCLLLDNGSFIQVNEDTLQDADAQVLYDDLKSQISKSSTTGVIGFTKGTYNIDIKASHVVGIQIGDTSQRQI